jgi:hypothetical protein
MDRMVDPEEIEDALTRFDGRRMASLRLLVSSGVCRARVSPH